MEVRSDERSGVCSRAGEREPGEVSVIDSAGGGAEEGLRRRRANRSICIVSLGSRNEVAEETRVNRDISLD
jgi:hypothetical protein